MSVDIDSSHAWVIKDKAATRSGSDSDNFYHLNFDIKQLRLRITDGAEDREASAKRYQNLAVEDIKVDGKRLPLFQWCLVNQQRHSRFLQQGLKVKKDVCKNHGENGSFVMRLNAATLDALKNGQVLSFKLRPFRSSINLNFDISDFSAMLAGLTPVLKPVQKQPEPVAVVEKKMVQKKCKAQPPKGFAEIKAVEYLCDDAVAKAEAEAGIAALVSKERERAAKLAAERERKRKQAEAAKKAKALAEKKAAEEAAAKLAAEQAALAESEAAKQEINAEITNKMLAVCQKKWNAGEHRCYCEKFIEHAPAGIKSDPSCSAN
ncbi:MAG: hypothetical protein OQK32_02720 [Gammaproteobacteria bacterium]|nr:hypothetical protein [Gammaproteobacteria bacterium]